MRAESKVRREQAKQAVLDELARLSEDRHPRNQTLLARFARCTQRQQTVLMISRAVDAERRAYSATPLAPPPGWLPPLA
jgi:uncharacterized membrane protein YgcG